MKRIVWTEAAKADLRGLEKPTANHHPLPPPCQGGEPTPQLPSSFEEREMCQRPSYPFPQVFGLLIELWMGAVSDQAHALSESEPRV